MDIKCHGVTKQKGNKPMSKPTFENGRPVPVANGLKSRWDFAPDEKRVNDLRLYTVYNTGAMNSPEMLDKWHQHQFVTRANRVMSRIRKIRQKADVVSI